MFRCEQKFTNTDGMIFLMTSNGGKLYCFDPFGEKQLEEIQNIW